MRNDLPWRVAQLEREVDRLKQGQPDVVADRVGRLAKDVAELRRHIDDQFSRLAREIEKGDADNTAELGAQRKIMIGAWVSLATGLIVAYVIGSGGGFS